MAEPAKPHYRHLGRAFYGYPWSDVQQAEVYSAEDELQHGTKRYRREFGSTTKVIDWLNKRVLPSEWWTSRFPKGGTVFVIGKPLYLGNNWAGGYSEPGGNFSLWLPRWAWNDAVLLHEVTHLVARFRYQQCHGPAYARDRLSAQYEFGLAGSGDRLAELFDKYGVRRAK